HDRRCASRFPHTHLDAISPPSPHPPDPAYRRQRIAHTALSLLLAYVTSPDAPSPLPVRKNSLVVKIGQDNTPSIRLFEGLGFTIVKTVDVFEEVEMRLAGQAAEWVAGTVRALEHGQVDDRPSAGEPDACGS
ncbi:hypothetical protein EW146_g10391, partial [Bondarzewia mesenterica]